MPPLRSFSVEQQEKEGRHGFKSHSDSDNLGCTGRLFCQTVSSSVKWEWFICLLPRVARIKHSNTYKSQLVLRHLVHKRPSNLFPDFIPVLVQYWRQRILVRDGPSQEDVEWEQSCEARRQVSEGGRKDDKVSAPLAQRTRSSQLRGRRDEERSARGEASRLPGQEQQRNLGVKETSAL